MPIPKRDARATRRPRSAKPRALAWETVADAEAEHYELVLRVIAAHRGDDRIDRLLRVDRVSRDLWRALARGEDAGDGIDRLYEAATRRSDLIDSSLHIIIAIAMVARRSDEEIGRSLWIHNPEQAPNASDQQLAGLACLYIERRLSHEAARLRKHPAKVALAVRRWRRRPGRPARGQQAGSKWEAISELIDLAGLGKLDEKTVEQRWKEHGPEIG